MSGIAEIQGGARTCAEVLSEVGALAIPRALDTRICAGLIREMKSSPATPTRPISPETMEREHFPDFVRSKTGEGSPFARAIVELALARHLPRLRAHFQRPLEWNTELHFLTYEKGDFIGPHCDVMDGDAVLEKIRERILLFSLCLNDSDGPDGHAFEGGAFVLHPAPDRRLAITCAAGTLLAFRADLVHSVREVTGGTRHSVAGWFRTPRAAG